MIKPYLSVIMPVYNGEKYLQNSISHILKQSFKDFELIIVDDGSEDRSSDIVASYKKTDKRIRYYKIKNQGAFKARIYGVHHALGEYILFCDADDYYFNRYAFQVVRESILFSCCDLLQFGYIKKYNHISKKVQVKQRIEVDHGDFITNEYPKFLCSFWDDSHLSISLWNKVYHNSLFNNLPEQFQFNHLFWGEDFLINLLILEKCQSVLFIPDCLYVYQAKTGETTRFSLHAMNDLDIIKQYQIKQLEKNKSELKEVMMRIMYSEIPGWFFVFVQQCLQQIGVDNTICIIEEDLQLPSFVSAREYYAIHDDIHTEEIDLFRDADINGYIQKARQKKITMKEKMISFLKRI